MSAHAVPAPGGPVATRPGIDPRGTQFTAAVTAVVVVVALLSPARVALAIVSVQAVLFLVGVARGMQNTPHAWVFRTLIRPRLAPPDHLEDPAPPRFASGLGLVFTTTAVVAFVLDAVLVAQVALGACLVAALLNALFRFCLGCELYLLLKRIGG
jgi:hypothetical protein